MSNLKINEELCGICADLAKIVTEQQKLLAQHDAVALAEDIALPCIVNNQERRVPLWTTPIYRGQSTRSSAAVWRRRTRGRTSVSKCLRRTCAKCGR